MQIFPDTFMDADNGTIRKLTDGLQAVYPSASAYNIRAMTVRLIVSETMREYPNANNDNPAKGRTFSLLCGAILYPMAKKSRKLGDDPVEMLMDVYGLTYAQTKYLMPRITV